MALNIQQKDLIDFQLFEINNFCYLIIRINFKEKYYKKKITYAIVIHASLTICERKSLI